MLSKLVWSLGSVTVLQTSGSGTTFTARVWKELVCDSLFHVVGLTTEVGKPPIAESAQVDYLFHRMFAIIRLLLKSRWRGHLSLPHETAARANLPHTVCTY